MYYLIFAFTCQYDPTLGAFLARHLARFWPDTWRVSDPTLGKEVTPEVLQVLQQKTSAPTTSAAPTIIARKLCHNPAADRRLSVALGEVSCPSWPRTRDVNLSHCGNAISRMWSPFCWVRWVKRHGGKTPRQGIRCLLPPNQIFPAGKCGEVGV